MPNRGRFPEAVFDLCCMGSRLEDVVGQIGTTCFCHVQARCHLWLRRYCQSAALRFRLDLAGVKHFGRLLAYRVLFAGYGKIERCRQSYPHGQLL